MGLDPIITKRNRASGAYWCASIKAQRCVDLYEACD